MSRGYIDDFTDYEYTDRGSGVKAAHGHEQGHLHCSQQRSIRPGAVEKYQESFYRRHFSSHFRSGSPLGASNPMIDRKGSFSSLYTCWLLFTEDAKGADIEALGWQIGATIIAGRVLEFAECTSPRSGVEVRRPAYTLSTTNHNTYCLNIIPTLF